MGLLATQLADHQSRWSTWNCNHLGRSTRRSSAPDQVRIKSSTSSALETAELCRTMPLLRGTAIRWMAEAGCTEAEMASDTGHSLSGAKTMLDHDWSASKAQAEEAMRRLRQFKTGTKL